MFGFGGRKGTHHKCAVVFRAVFHKCATGKSEKRLNISMMYGSTAERAKEPAGRSMSARSARLSDRHRSVLISIQPDSGLIQRPAEVPDEFLGRIRKARRMTETKTATEYKSVAVVRCTSNGHYGEIIHARNSDYRTDLRNGAAGRLSRFLDAYIGLGFGIYHDTCPSSS